MIIYVTIPAGVHYEGLRFCQPGKQTSKELLWTLVKYLQGPHQPAAHVTKIWAMSRPVTAPHGSLVGGHWWVWALGCFSLWWHGLWACCRRCGLGAKGCLLGEDDAIVVDIRRSCTESKCSLTIWLECNFASWACGSQARVCGVAPLVLKVEFGAISAALA